MNKRALITGASNGIGYALATEFAKIKSSYSDCEKTGMVHINDQLANDAPNAIF